MKVWQVRCTVGLDRRKVVGFFLVLVTLVNLLAMALYPQPVEAAQVTIDASSSTTATEHSLVGNATVFISDQVGYRFYVDGNGTCVYSKTTNGGTSWNTAVAIDSQTDCFSPVVWYDQWTPGDSGTYIHILTHDTSADDLWYNRLDTSSDTLLMGTAPLSVTAATLQGTGSITAGTNLGAITKGTDGTVYIAISDNDAYIVECSVSCGTGSNWTETGPTGTLDATNDHQLLLPLLSGDIMLINDDISADDIRYRIWNNASWGSWNTIDANAPEVTATYPTNLAGVTDIDTGDVYLAYIADAATLGTDDDIRTAKYSSGAWTSKTDVLTNTSLGLTNVAIGMDYNSGALYVAYTGRTTPATAATANVYWKSSTDGMSTWSTQNGPVNTTTDDLYSLSLNGVSDERIHISWYGANPDDLFGDTIADVAPAVRVSARGTQTTPLSVNTINTYVGAAFVLTENLSSRSVTDITISENGSIDGSTEISNVKLFYDLDTTAPYDCASESYTGTESQFGSTDTNGFSGANGVSSFNGSVTISTTQTMCLYVVVDISDYATNNATLDVEITNPNTDVVVSGGGNVLPKTAVALSGASTIVSPVLTQTHYHWRNDNGTETTATSRTGGVEDTPLTSLQQNTPVRVRVEVSNEGSVAAAATNFRLEYAESPGLCADATGWTDVGASSDAWDMYNSANLTDGANTTNIAVTAGGVTNENTTFLTPNGGVRETSSQTGSLTLGTTNYLEMEFSIIPTASSIEGQTYCFRVTQAGTPLHVYTTYPRVTVSADVTVAAVGSQVATADIPTANTYFGGSYAIKENASSRSVTGITLTENGTAEADTEINNVRLRYDLDTSAPYDCASESYAGTEPQFGATTTFSGADGTASFSGSVFITTTQALCLYVLADITSTARNSHTLNFLIAAPAADIVVSGGGSISPSIPVDMTSSTTFNGAIVTQTHYHWRNDDGSEVLATSATAGSEDTAYTDMPLTSPIRLRLGISNEGFASSVPYRYKLEYGVKQTSCDAISVWTDADGGGISWSMYDSANLTNGETTTNIAVASGGMTDENTTFLGSNSDVRDTESRSATTTLTTTQHTDLEYSISSTADTPYNTTFCFRVTQDGTPLLAYDTYPEITTVKKRDFYVQRGVTSVTGTGVTLTAGTNYVAPASASRAFVRITSMYSTGAGSSATGNTQNTRQVTAYISDPGNITTSFTISRPTGATGNTQVAWEIIEFIGPDGADNEMVVRDNNTLQFSSSALTATGTAVTGIADDADVAIFITGVRNANNTATTYNANQVTAKWDAASQSPVFERLSSAAVVDVSYAVVEFTGLNWKVQRVEHTYSTVGSTETESIAPVNSLSRTFMETQKRISGLNTQINFGHEVWLSSIGAVSFLLPTGAGTASNHVSVAWIIENTQTSNGAMLVQRSNGTLTTGTEPRTTTVNLTTPVDSQSNTSLFSMSTQNQATTNYPRVLGYYTLNSLSTYIIWNSDISTANNYTFRTETVEWPVSDMTIRQNYFRFYSDSGTLTLTDPWPVGAADLGENQSIATLDEPLADGDYVRLRMSLKVANATMPAGLLSAKLQYGVRTTSCSAISGWIDVGALGSGEIWRGYDITGISDGVSLSGNPPSGGDLLLSVADKAGRYTEANPSVANEFAVSANQDVEYDWVLQQNGAAHRTTYCFRIVKNDDTPLDGYNNYPQIRTEGFTPATESWRWYDDESSLTPTVPLDDEGVAPSDVAKDNVVKLRVTVAELKNLSQADARFRLQYATQPDFSDVSELVATSSCNDISVWCYGEGEGDDNVTISTAVLSSSDSCSGGVGTGCGVYNESATDMNGFTHLASAQTEYEFTVHYTNVVRNYGQVYYFRLFDIKNNEPVLANTGYQYPSLSVESTHVTFVTGGITAGTIIDTYTMNINTTPGSMDYGELNFDTDYYAGQYFSADTNDVDGYQVFLVADGGLRNTYGSTINEVVGSNLSPSSWSVGCVASTSCYGYHPDDDVLIGGSTRFTLDDTFAPPSDTPGEIYYTSTPGLATFNVVFRLRVGESQPAGTYQQALSYVIVSLF